MQISTYLSGITFSWKLIFQTKTRIPYPLLCVPHNVCQRDKLKTADTFFCCRKNSRIKHIFAASNQKKMIKINIAQIAFSMFNKQFMAHSISHRRLLKLNTVFACAHHPKIYSKFWCGFSWPCSCCCVCVCVFSWCAKST